MSAENELPSGWSTTTLAHVGRLFCGQSPHPSTVNHDGNGTPYVTGPEHWDGNRLALDKWTTAPTRVVPDGCLFVTVKGAGVGKLFQGVACAIGRDVYAFKPEEGVSPKFVEYALGFKLRQLIAKAQGDIPGLSKGHILDQEVLFPPVNEQARIVSKIDELLSDVDAGVAALERARANLKKYRAAVLKAAVTGELTADWRAAHPNVEPASALLDRILTERRERWEADQLAKYKASEKTPPKGWREKYTPPIQPDVAGRPELLPGWCWASVDQVAEPGEQGVMTGPFGSMLGREDFVQEGIPLLTIGCLTEAGISLEKAVYISQAKANELSRYQLREGDLLFSRSASVGRVGHVTKSLAGSLINYHIMRLRLAVSVLMPEFFATYVRGAGEVKDYLRKVNHGATRDGINSEALLAMPVAIPPIDEQLALTVEVDRLVSVIAATENYIGASLKRAARLRQSILKEAFAGRLVPQDPSDEPASVLLDRIRQARQSEAPAARPRRKKADQPEPTE